MTQTSTSLLQQLLQELPQLRTQIYYKASLTAVSHAIEDLVLLGDDAPLVIANFQQERYYRQEANRYHRIAQKTDRLYVLAAPETDFATQTVNYATIGLDPRDALAQEWHLVIIANVGHELRTPLSTIQICLESLTTEPDMPAKFRMAMLDTALCDADRLRKLVGNFLLLSRLEGNVNNWELEPLSLSDAIDLAVSSLVPLDDYPAIRVDLPTQLPLVLVDGEAVSELLAQLLDNACKFTPLTGQIEIGARVSDAAIEVTIADTGRGLEPKQLDRIFDRFYQTEGFLRRTAGDVGLGLAICQRIVERLGGQIWATSAGLNCGSIFYFTLAIA